MRIKLHLTLVIALFTSLPLYAQPHNPDPWEGFNRKMFVFNEHLDSYVLKPTAVGYKKITPTPVRTGVSNFFANLGEIKVILSDLLQLKLVQAGSDTGRFVVNSTVGVFGIFDVAKHIGLQKHDEDFGQALGYWGVGSGPYLMLPVLGPSTVRDTTGVVGEYKADISFMNLGSNEAQNFSIAALYAINLRAKLLDAEGLIQGDRYVFLRSFYLQRRDYLINDGKTKNDFGDDDWDDFDDTEE